MKNFKLYLQHDAMQCGLACLHMIYSHYGADYIFDRSPE
ncbi:cysteine peptidase family C39 domain-containing protein [Xylanibacter rarus]